MCVHRQDDIALVEVTWIWSTFLFFGVFLLFPHLPSPPLPLPFLPSSPLPSTPLPSTPLHSPPVSSSLLSPPLPSPRSDLVRSLNTDEAVALGAVYQAAVLSKDFRVKTVLIKDANTFSVEVRVMSSSVAGKR